MSGEAEIYRGLEEILRDVFLRDDLAITPDLTASQVEGWDSFKQIEIVMAAEEKWNIKFSTRELDGLRSIGDLARAIAARTQRQA